MEDGAQNTVGESPCEAELQELMEQIDIMVSNKKLDWERKMRALETRLDLRDQELASAQMSLDQKGQEVGILRQKLDSLEKCNLAMTQNYEGQLQCLKAQFSKLTNSFEKLRLHQMKQSRLPRKEVPHLQEEAPFEASDLSQKLEEFRAKSREWDKKEFLYQTHLVSLDAQQKLLSEKCHQFQKQAQSYQTQLNGKKQCVADGSSETLLLTCDPQSPSCEAPERDKFIIEKLKSAVSEIALSRNKLQEENQKLLKELKMYQRQCQAMEAGLSEVRNELQSRDDLLRIIEMERLQLHRELLKAGEWENAPGNKKRLESSYSPSIKEQDRKRKELFPATPDQRSHETELNKIRSQQYLQEHFSSSSEQERMRSEISELTEELHQKELTIFSVMKKAALLERQLKMELEIKEKMLAKQQVSDGKSRNTRVENKPLKGMMGDLDPGRCMGVAFSSREHTRHMSINKLQNENEQLRSDLARLQGNGKASCAGTHGEARLHAFHSHTKTERSQDRLGQGSVSSRSATPPLAPVPFQSKERSSPLWSEDHAFPLSPPDMAFPASMAAQHFLLEEEKKAKDLEKLLNTHIEELQRHTGLTLNRYTRLSHGRHM